MSANTENQGKPVEGGTTHFGYEKVPETDKAARVGSVFSNVATRYDLMNDLMSAGIHRLWKAALIDWLNPRDGMSIVDVGGGTGDIAFRVLAHADANITICDRNADMLNEGRNRAFDSGMLSGPSWICGDAEELPLSDSSVDAYLAAFSLRNVTRLPAALAEAKRVLMPGGRFLCLEFNRAAMPAIKPFYDAYSFQVLPVLGQWITGDGDAYRYLVESIRCFPAQTAFSKNIEDAGLRRVQCRNMSGGIVAMHSAWRD